MFKVFVPNSNHNQIAKYWNSSAVGIVVSKEPYMIIEMENQLGNAGHSVINVRRDSSLNTSIAKVVIEYALGPGKQAIILMRHQLLIMSYVINSRYIFSFKTFI